MDHYNHSFLCANCKHANKVFCAKNNDMVEGLSEVDTTKDYLKGYRIFKEGVYPSGIHIIYSGKVKLVKTSDEGKEQIVRFAKSGDLLGYRTLLGNQVYKCSAIALNDIKVCHVPKDKFFKNLVKNHNLYLDLLKKLSNDLARAEDIILSVSQKTAKERIAESIVLLYFKFGFDSQNIINVQLSRKELGNMAGTTIETTIRVLSSLKKEGLISFDGKKFIVKNIHELMSLSHYND